MTGDPIRGISPTSDLFLWLLFVVPVFHSAYFFRDILLKFSLFKQGHELTLCILNRLYREAEQDQDFLSSRTATSVYESFLLIVVCLLKIDETLSQMLFHLCHKLSIFFCIG